jgi:nucleoside triphosphate pyrophosphatase
MLESAGVSFGVAVPNVDEAVMRGYLLANGAGADQIAMALAEAKALAVAERHEDALVIGSDQVLECEDRLIEKATDEESARVTLEALRGRKHRLISAVALAKNEAVLWRFSDEAILTMRDFSDEFLVEYLAAEIPEVLGSVGCYRIEGRGVQLFEHIAGDYFAIRGLPLIAVIAALRRYGGLAE